MIRSFKTIGQSLMRGFMLSPLVAMVIPLNAIAAQPPGIGCPDGWIPRPPELNPALGPCMPNTIQAPSQPEYRQIAIIKPDLQVKKYVFSSPKTVRVYVVNQGKANAGSNVLGLTVRRINGTPVGRTTTVKVPAIAKGQGTWVSVNADSILPNFVKLKSTTFRLDADFSKTISESNENNNTLWHNL